MIIRSITLKNIKSYGTGPEGNGCIVTFEPGINRIAGKNGHGKTTLIEALGYAIFLTEPAHEENFRTETYLLRTGEKSGEIAVEFQHGDALYRLEKGVGQSKTRNKVIALADNSIEAEGDKEVAAYLCHLFGLADPARLTELFSKLVGVKQGRLTWPFDSKKGQAQAHFEPLLDVEVFRDCFNRLKPVSDGIEERMRELDKKRAVAQERVHDRQDAPDKLRLAGEGVAKLSLEKQDAGKVSRQAAASVKQHEASELALREAERKMAEAKAGHNLASERLKTAITRLDEAKAAEKTTGKTSAAYNAYQAAGKELVLLRTRQEDRTRLERQKAVDHSAATGLAAEVEAARNQAHVFREQIVSMSAEAKKISARYEELDKSLRSSRSEHEKSIEATADAREALDHLAHWKDSVEDLIGTHRSGLAARVQDSAALASWDEAAARTATREKSAIAGEVERLAAALEGVVTLERSLAVQLKEIGDGICPFLKEKCEQFDPGKVKTDLSDRKQEAGKLAKELEAARKMLEKAEQKARTLGEEDVRLKQVRKDLDVFVAGLIRDRKSLIPVAHGSWLALLSGYLPALADRLKLPIPPVSAKDTFLDQAGALVMTAVKAFIKQEEDLLAALGEAAKAVTPAFQKRFKESEAAKTRRDRDEKERETLTGSIAKFEKDLESREASAGRQLALAEKKKHEVTVLEQTLGALETKLKEFAGLDDDIREREKTRDKNIGGHKAYIEAQSIARQLPQCETVHQKAGEAVARSASLVTDRQAVLAKAVETFDSKAFEAAKAQYEAALQAFAAAEAKLQALSGEKAREQKRYDDLQAALHDAGELNSQLARLAAEKDITARARDILKKAAPYVARTICNRIAVNAQQIYSTINHEPGELTWSAENYSLCISPGDRRFAMLSGGEQTKLALSMTLAMIKEFSGLRMCIFDEPTYGVDAESRQRLADAILEIQEAARFDQLLLVSHDDAFEGRIEHTVTILKAMPGGSYAENCN